MGPIKSYKFVFESKSSSSEAPYYKYYKGKGKTVVDAFIQAAKDFLNDYPNYRARYIKVDKVYLYYEAIDKYVPVQHAAELCSEIIVHRDKGRPKIKDTERKDEKITIRITKSEKERLDSIRDNEGVTYRDILQAGMGYYEDNCNE